MDQPRVKSHHAVILALLLIVALFAGFGLLYSMQPSTLKEQFHAEETEFLEFTAKYQKTYASEEERAFRFQLFRDTAAYIRVHNQVNNSYKLSVNEFADMTSEEFKARYLSNFKLQKSNLSKKSLDTEDLPTSVDWVEKGAVNTPKNQGSCGSCYTFSATGAIEALHYLQTGSLVNLSQQQIVDCSRKYGNEGCDGGLMDDAFRYIIAVGGLETAEDYPYNAHNGKCREAKRKFAADIRGYHDLKENNELQLKAAVAQQPVSVGVQANQAAFMYYSTGVVDSGCGHDLDHGVLVVGYGEQDGKPYWLIKNSWGPYWGDHGYLRIARDDGNSSSPGMCGVATMGSYPY